MHDNTRMGPQHQSRCGTAIITMPADCSSYEPHPILTLLPVSSFSVSLSPPSYALQTLLPHYRNTSPQNVPPSNPLNALHTRSPDVRYAALVSVSLACVAV